MDLQDFKRWHWIVIGLIVGLALSVAFSDHDVDQESGMRDKEIKQLDFERAAFSRNHASGEPILQTVIVEPAVDAAHNEQKQIVRGTRLRYSDKYKKEFTIPFYYYADVPYKPIELPNGVQWTAGGSVLEFLHLAQRTMSLPADGKNKQPWQGASAMRIRYGWEYQTRWNMLLWALGGMIVIGGVWPTLFDALIGAGLGPARKARLDAEADYLNRFGKFKEEPVVASRQDVGIDEQKRLDELNAALESGLKPAGNKSDGADDDSGGVLVGTPAIRKLEEGSEPLIAAQVHEPELSDEEKAAKYRGGDFYPVARGATKKE